jgi:ubiquitin-conjugating enzyme E2 variant
MTTSLLVASSTFQAVLIVLLADFVAGVVHWAEDAYFTEATPVLGPLVIKPNIVHHHFPRHFTKLSWWESCWQPLLLGLVALAVAWPLGWLSWQLVLFVAVSVNANHVHKLSHRTRAENGRLVSCLQDWRILQTPRHHGLHHADPKNTHYCPITNAVNPVLELIGFWPRLEAVVAKVTGATHRHDTAVRGQGPGPAWLEAYRPAPVTAPARPGCDGTHCRACARCAAAHRERPTAA